MAAKGHTRLRGKVWYVIIDLPRDPLEPKKRQQKWIRTDAETREQAEVERERVARCLAEGEPFAPRTVGEQCAAWLEATTPTLAPGSVETYAGHLRRHILPYLGDFDLANLGPLHIRNWLVRVRKRGLAESTLATIFFVLHAALEDAVRLEMIPKNPARQVTRPTKPRKERAIWDGDEARRFLAFVRGDRFESLYLTAIGTGLRKGELLALRWRDVDLRAGALTVRAAQIEIKGQGATIAAPKTRHSIRRVSLPAFVADALAAHQRTQDEERAKLGHRWADTWLIWCKPRGGLLPSSTFDVQWMKLRRRFVAAGLPPIAFHDLRHLHATLALEAGVDPKTVSQRLGHHSAAFTLDKYGHVTQRMHDMAAEAIGRILFGSVDESGPTIEVAQAAQALATTELERSGATAPMLLAGDSLEGEPLDLDATERVCTSCRRLLPRDHFTFRVQIAASCWRCHERVKRENNRHD
jgi:integrase